MDFVITDNKSGLHVLVFYREYGIDKEKLITVESYCTSLTEVAQYCLPNIQKLLLVIGSGSYTTLHQ